MQLQRMYLKKMVLLQKQTYMAQDEFKKLEAAKEDGKA